jgi:mono/diheme cytochrome c family protein
MQRKTISVVCTLAALAAGPAFAADPKIVTYFQENCGTCHGEKGEGMKGLAPAFKGNDFIIKGSEADIAATITKGRAGDQKKYKDLPSPMPPASMSDARLSGIIAYLKNEIQK